MRESEISLVQNVSLSFVSQGHVALVPNVIFLGRNIYECYAEIDSLARCVPLADRASLIRNSKGPFVAPVSHFSRGVNYTVCLTTIRDTRHIGIHTHVRTFT